MGRRGDADAMTTTAPRTSLWPALVGALRGSVLELGPGAGANLRHYGRDVRWLGVEPSARAMASTAAAADALGMRARVLPGRAEHLELPDASMDAVVCSFVLCSVRDQSAALAEVRRVLVPGGRFVFAEHVAAPPGTWVRRGQHVVAGLNGVVGLRCRPNRDTGDAVTAAGLEVTDLHSFTMTGPFGAGIPQLVGAAVRPEGQLS
jgi:SAM-dependent methyltransferase